MHPFPSTIDDIPVTIVGGYLGSGKTTLVNHVLRTATERVAVLVNDFGEVDIDAALIEHDDGEVLALANGCICCSLVDGLAVALDKIASLAVRPDRLVIEASGVADPGSVAAYGQSPGFDLDAVVVMVDVETIRQRAADTYVGDTVLRQLAAADLVVVNKVDLADQGDVAAVIEWLGEWTDRAVVVETVRAEVEPALLFGRPRRLPSAEGGDERPTPIGPTAQGGPPAPPAEDVYQSWVWVGDGEVEREAIDAMMDELPPTVVRAKGILRLRSDDRPAVLQRVGGRWTLRPARSGSAAAAATGSRLIVIGQRGAIDDDWLARRLDR